MDLSSLNMENLESIMSSISSEDMAKITEMASELLGNQNTTEEKKQTAKSNASKVDFSDIFSGIDPSMMMKLMNIIGKLNNAPNDPRCDFLLSLKPLLSEKRRHKADEAIKMLQLMSMLPLLKELGE